MDFAILNTGVFFLNVGCAVQACPPESRLTSLSATSMTGAHGQCAMHDFGASESIHRYEIRNHIKPNRNCVSHPWPANILIFNHRIP
jgi:hypothetical protein